MRNDYILNEIKYILSMVYKSNDVLCISLII